MTALRRTLIVLAALAAVAVAGLAAWELTPSPRQADSGGATGTAEIGGPFTLVNTEGETVTADDFRGRYMLVYFGFTFCPDVCPTSLMDMTRALDRLAETAPGKAERVVPVFITVDPARDTVAVMDSYVENFHPRLVGLTGSAQQVAEAAAEYRVYYEKVAAEQYRGGQAAAAGDSGADYLMDHSSYIYLMGPDGRYLTNFKYGASPQEIAAGLRQHVE